MAGINRTTGKATDLITFSRASGGTALRKISYGSELVTNGTFDSDTSGWAANNSSLSAVSGRLRLTQQGAGLGFAQTTFATVVGKVYRLAWDYVAGTAPTPTTRVATSTLGSDIASTASTDASITFVAQSTTTYVNFRMATTTDGLYSEFDNISVKEINPLSVSIQMQGEMTYADTGAASVLTFFDWKADISNRIFNDLDTDGASTGEFNTNQVALGITDRSVGPETTYSPGVNVPFNIASRHGSTFINGAVDGTALTADTTPVALPDLSATDLQLGYDYMGTISLFRVWSDDLGDTGIADASELSTVPSLSLTFDGLSTSFTDGGLLV